jgi:hypothetical protein
MRRLRRLGQQLGIPQAMTHLMLVRLQTSLIHGTIAVEFSGRTSGFGRAAHGLSATSNIRQKRLRWKRCSPSCRP